MKAVAVVALMIVFNLGAASAAAAPKTNLYGSVACVTGERVVGIWVERSNGAGQWASFTRRSDASWLADYTVKFKNPSVFKKKTVSVRLHVGCGGSASAWDSTLKTAFVNYPLSTWEAKIDLGIAALCHSRKRGCAFWSEMVLIGMPFDGYWACPNGATQDYCENGGSTSSHPSSHHGRGDWTVDLYANQAPIKVHVFARARDSLKLKITRFENACGSTGKTIETGIILNRVQRGAVVFTHVNPNTDIAFLGATISPNDTIGWTELWPQSARCWEVSTNGGVHTHFAAINEKKPSKLGLTYSCYWDQDGSTIRSMTDELAEGSLLGIVGDRVAFKRQTACR